MSGLRASTRLLALAYDSLSSQQRSICQATCATLRSLSSATSPSVAPNSLQTESFAQRYARGFAAGPGLPVDVATPGSPGTDPPAQPSTESYQAAVDTSSSDSDAEEDDADKVIQGAQDEDQAMLQPPQANETPQDELLKKIQSSSKKHQRHILQQLLTGNELSGADTMGQQEADAATIAAARDKYSLKLVDVNSTNKGSPAGGVQSFSAMVVVGDHEGSLGHGTGKAAELVSAIRKASMRALNSLTYVPRYERFTILHPVDTKYGKCKLRMYPLASGGGVRANALLGDIAALAGINSIGIKTHGSRNARNSVKALFQAFEQLTTIERQAKQKGLAAVEVIVGSRPKRQQRFK